MYFTYYFSLSLSLSLSLSFSAGLEAIIAARLKKKGIGFNTPLNNKEEDHAALLKFIEPVGIDMLYFYLSLCIYYYFFLSPSVFLSLSVDLNRYGLIPEFLGRLPTIVNTEALTEDQLVEVITKPKDAILKQYNVQVI